MDNSIFTEILISNTTRRIIYLVSGPKAMRPTLLPEIMNELQCIVEIYNDWSSMINRIGELEYKNLPMPLILIDAAFLLVKDIFVTEIIDMLSSRHKCMSPPRKMQLGIVIETDEDRALIKQIKETDALGVVPCEKVFGYENTIAALKDLLAWHSHWPSCVAPVHHVSVHHTSASTIHLTDRQQEVLHLVCNRGLSNKKIAQILKITESTVKVHMSAILKEYGVRNRTQLVLAANSGLKA